MKYEIIYNRVRKVWTVWKIWPNGNAETVKAFKTEKAATNYIEKVK